MFKTPAFNLLITLASLAFTASAIAATAPTPQRILEFVDKARKPGESAIVLITVSVTSNETTDTRKYRLFDSGAEKSIIEFLDPRQRGQKVLSTPESLWFYSPRIHKAIKIPISQRLFGEANFGDIVQLRWLQDYDPAFDEQASEVLAGIDCWRLLLEAKNTKATYKKILLWVTKANLVPVKAHYFLASGKHIKTAEFVAPKIEDGTLLNDHWILREPSASSRHTSIKLDDVKATSLSDQMFTVPYLEQVQ